jgi:hypothetical protein
MCLTIKFESGGTLSAQWKIKQQREQMKLVKEKSKDEIAHLHDPPASQITIRPGHRASDAKPLPGPPAMG